MISALVLTAAIQVEINLGAFIAAHRRNRWRWEAARNPSRVTCGIRDVGYRFIGEPGTRVRFCRRSYVIPSEGRLELISGKVRGSYDCREVPAGADSAHDQFGFRDVEVSK